MCRDIINQIFQQSLKGITAFSVSSVCMLNRNINNTVLTVLLMFRFSMQTELTEKAVIPLRDC